MTDRRFWRLFSEPNAPLLVPLGENHDQYRANRAAFDATKSPGRVVSWELMALRLPEGARRLDYHPTLYRFVACSPKVREVVEQHLGPADEVQWLPVTIEQPQGVAEAYVMQPLPGPEAVDADRSHYGAGPVGLVKAVFDQQVVGDRQVLKYPYGPTAVLSDQLRRAWRNTGAMACAGSANRPHDHPVSSRECGEASVSPRGFGAVAEVEVSLWADFTTETSG